MKPSIGGLVLVILLFCWLVSAPPAAYAACSDLGGTEVAGPPVECRINSNQAKTGDFTVGSVGSPENLHFVGSGGITTGGGPLSVTVHGDLIMDGGTFINANGGGCPGPFAGAVTLNVDGNINLKLGSSITSDGCKGGPINISSGTGNFDANGLIESVGSVGGVGSNQPPGGGPITLTASCNLTVTVGGRVSSRGGDAGSDLVQLLGGCLTNVLGLVESTGKGHTVPNNPPNHCAVGVLAGFKPPNSTACVLIVGGDQGVTIDATQGGEVNADIKGAADTSWIDIFAKGPIVILGTSTQPFAVHANNAGNQNTGGTITAKSQSSSLTANGLAFQADGVGAGANGGSITAEAAINVTLDESDNFARGDFVATGGFGDGGHISARAFTGALNWRNFAGGVLTTTIGDVRPVGSDVPGNKQGAITLTACLGVNTNNTSFSVNGSALPGFPAVNGSNCSATAPDIPAFVQFAQCGCQPLACP